MRELRLDPTAEELKDIINEVDTDSNGAVDFEGELTPVYPSKTEPS